MDWRTVRFDWNRARAFLVTAEEGSLSAAARALGMAQPTLSRQVEALEQELDVTLFERVGRRLVLTAAAEELLVHARAMGEAAGRFSIAASGQSQALDGPVCISAGEAFAVLVLPAMLADLRQRHPGIHVEVIATDQQSDLRRREADIAVRNVRPDDPDLIARKVRDMHGYLYAATRYLDTLGRPSAPADLNGADFISWDRGEAMIQLLASLGISVSQANFPLISGNHIAQWAMVKQGLGIGVMASVVGDAEPLVERVLPAMDPVTFPVWLVSHRELHTSRRVRAVFDRLAEGFADLE